MKSSQKSLEIFRTLANSQPANTKAQQSLAISYIKAGDVLGNPNFPNSGDAVGAMQNYRSSLAIWEALAASDSINAQVRCFLGLINERIGTMFETEGNFEDALDHYRKSLVIREAFASDFPANTDAVRDVAITHEKIASGLTATSDLAAALESRRKSLEIFRGLVKADPQNVQARQSLAISYMHLGDTMLALRKVAEALNEYREALAIQETLPTDTLSMRELAELCAKLGQIHFAFGSDWARPAQKRKDFLEEARTWYQRSLTTWQDLRSRGMAGKTDAGKADQVQAEIRKCEAEIVKL